MSLVSDTELIRARWRRHLDALALDEETRSDFASAGLAGRVNRLVARLILLPSDPDCDRWEFDDAFWKGIEDHKSVIVGEGELRLGDEVVTTAHAAAIVRTHGYGMPWQSYVAVHRNGAIEVGLGDRRHRHGPGDDSEEAVYVDLIKIVAFTWAMGELARKSRIDETAGSCLLAVALPNMHGALLAGLGEGYCSPVGAQNRVVAGQAACLYSLVRPSQRVVRTSRRGSGWSVVLLSGVVCRGGRWFSERWGRCVL